MKSSEGTARSSVRTLGFALALFTLVLAIIATQWPFEYDLTQAGLARRWSRVDWSWFRHTANGGIRFDRDFALNLLMLVPLGAGFGLWRCTRTLRAIAESLILGLLTSVVLEVAQLATRNRYTSFPDVWHNALGCVVGCALAIVILRVARISDET
jgi:VanZ like family